MVVYKPRPKTMDEASVFLLHKEGPKTEDQTKTKQKRKQIKTALSEKVSSLSWGSIDIGLVLGWLSAGVVFHIDVIRAGLKKRACGSSKVKFD